MTMVEGLHLLQEELAATRPELVLAGECLTEISFQRQAFAQTHPWGWGDIQQVHVEAAHPMEMKHILYWIDAGWYGDDHRGAAEGAWRGLGGRSPGR